MLETWDLPMQFFSFQGLGPQGPGRRPEDLKPPPHRALCRISCHEFCKESAAWGRVFTGHHPP